MTIQIYALGDSITYGFPYGPQYSWVRLVSQKLDINIDNGGVNGDTTTFMLHRLPSALAGQPSHLILLGGVNDAYWGQPLKTVLQNTEQICGSCMEKGIQPIIGLPTPVEEPQVEALLADYRASFADFARREKISVIPFHQAFLARDGRFKTELTTDGCHPNIDGYEAMAEVVERVLPGLLY
ncbi:MAG: GDSL-type esterase/lipase family protein [Bacillota bacterium]|nr:GDSL-type esterase/lipase family protein [Bacillota bacterium]MDW7684628.1 GDSL-type esterase/lipase family protein [Bacillota bacterium]